MARTFKRLTLRRVLWLFQHGIYRLEDGRVFSRDGKPIHVDRCDRGYRWVRIYYQGGRRAVSIHQLVWMVHNKRVIPRGRHVHHKNGRECEDPEDLEVLTRKQHDEAHARQAEAALDEFLRS